METMKGTVKAIKTREWNGKTMYTLGINTGGDKLEWVGFGVNNPGVREESVVTVECKKNDKGYWVGNSKTLQVHKDEKPAVSTQPKAQGAFVDRQESITTQSSMKDAINFLDMCARHGWYNPAKNTKAAKEAAMSAALDVVKKLAVDFQGYYMDPKTLLAEVLDNQANKHKEASDDTFDEQDDNGFDDDFPL